MKQYFVVLYIISYDYIIYIVYYDKIIKSINTKLKIPYVVKIPHANLMCGAIK